LEIYLAFQQWKNFENPLRIDKVIAMSSVCSFFGPPCILAYKLKNLEQILAGKTRESTYMQVNIVVNNFCQGCLCKSM